MNIHVPRTGHALVDAHVAELFRQSRQRPSIRDRRSTGHRPLRRP